MRDAVLVSVNHLASPPLALPLMACSNVVLSLDDCTAW
jgi:hypothetical protein